MKELDIIKKSGAPSELLTSSQNQVYHNDFLDGRDFEKKYNDTDDSEISEETLGDNEMKLYPPVDITELVVREVYQFRCETGKNFNFWNLINVNPESYPFPSKFIPSGDNPFDLYIDGIEGKINYYESDYQIDEDNLFKFSLYISIDYPEGKAGSPTIHFYVDPDGKIVDNNVEFHSTDSR